MKLYGLIGFPLSHSFSKKYFSQKFLDEGITDCEYELFPIEKIDQLENILRENPALGGLNVTIPYKQSVLEYLYSTEHLPLGLSACNCIKIMDGKLYGYNTDVLGFKKSFESLLNLDHKKALVLGNGGAAAAVVHVLGQLDIDYKIVSRKLGDDKVYNYGSLNEKLVSEHTVIINTTPLGTYPNTVECPPIPYRYITARHYCYDLVYNPPKTMFLKLAEKNGATIKNGSDMLQIQAEESWRIWNNGALGKK